LPFQLGLVVAIFWPNIPKEAVRPVSSPGNEHPRRGASDHLRRLLCMGQSVATGVLWSVVHGCRRGQWTWRPDVAHRGSKTRKKKKKKKRIEALRLVRQSAQHGGDRSGSFKVRDESPHHPSQRLHTDCHRWWCWGIAGVQPVKQPPLIFTATWFSPFWPKGSSIDRRMSVLFIILAIMAIRCPNETRWAALVRAGGF